MGKYGPEKTPYLDTFHAVCEHTVFMYFEWAMQISEMLCYEVLFQRLLERVQG